MGNQTVSDRFQELNFIKQIQNDALGRIKVYNNPKTNQQIATISLSVRQNHQTFMNKLKEAKTHKIPTLLTVISYQCQKQSCSNMYEITLTFKYYNRNLAQTIKNKQQQILQYKKNHHVYEQCRSIKLNDYKAIDELPQIYRQYINIYFREIEIVKMIDHLIGALYFLTHFQKNHQAINPSCIFIDQDTKFILIDRIAFHIPTNYERALQSRRGLNEKLQCYYLSPELMKGIKEWEIKPKFCAQKSDIFSVGLVALQMCTLEGVNVIYDYKNCKIMKTQLNKMLAKCKFRYSQQLSDLLQLMLKIDPKDRIGYNQLIETLNILFHHNLKQIDSLYQNSSLQKYKNQASFSKTVSQFQQCHQDYQISQSKSRLIQIGKPKFSQQYQSFDKIISQRNQIHR